MMRSRFTLMALLPVLAAVATAMPSFVRLIPNGDSFESAIYTGSYCDISDQACECSSLGHTSCSGPESSNVNSFGRDFQRSGLQWTTSFCKKDSDGDGYTNGEELGDPFCRWKVGAVPTRTDQLSHPGDAKSINSAPRAGANATAGANGTTTPPTSSSGSALDSGSVTFYKRRVVFIHAALMSVAFLLLFPFGIVAARFLKRTKILRDPLWFRVHYGVQTLGFIFALIAYIMIKNEKNWVIFKSNMTAHSLWGTLLIIAIVLQLLGGVVRPGLESRHRNKWYYFHAFLGTLSLVLSLYVIWEGMELLPLYSPEVMTTYKVLYAVWISAYGILAISMEVRWHMMMAGKSLANPFADTKSKLLAFVLTPITLVTALAFAVSVGATVSY